jgi:hypothetical protein
MTKPGVNSGEKRLSETATGLAEGTPLTLSLKTLTLSATAVEAAMVARAMETLIIAQGLPCREVLEVSIMVYFFDWFVSCLVWSGIHRMRETHTGQL